MKLADIKQGSVSLLLTKDILKEKNNWLFSGYLSNSAKEDVQDRHPTGNSWHALYFLCFLLSFLHAYAET